MGRSKRKPLAERDTNAASAQASANEDFCARYDNGKMVRISKEVCAALDREVEAKAAAIRAIRDAQIEALLDDLDSLESKFSEQVLDMPLRDFLEQRCHDLEAVKKEDGSVELRKQENGRLGFLPLDASEAVKEMLLQTFDHQFSEKVKEKFNSSMKSSVKMETPSLATPGPECRIGFTPKTLRLPKPGEVLVSMNGSPLGLYGDPIHSNQRRNIKIPCSSSKFSMKSRASRLVLI